MESDWPRRNKSHYVTEIVSWLGFAEVIFRRNQVTSRNTSAFAGYLSVVMQNQLLFDTQVKTALLTQQVGVGVHRVRFTKTFTL